MFTTLKKKIKDETGNDVTAAPLYASAGRRHSSQRSSLTGNGSGSYCSNGAAIELKDSTDNEVMLGQLSELTGKYDSLLSDYEQTMADKDRLEKTNEILEEALKVAQKQKELIYNEQDKIQNIQLEEISKLKSLLHFREQVTGTGSILKSRVLISSLHFKEAVDRLASIKQKDSQLESLQNENSRLRELEANFEDVQVRNVNSSYCALFVNCAWLVVCRVLAIPLNFNQNSFATCFFFGFFLISSEVFISLI